MPHFSSYSALTGSQIADDDVIVLRDTSDTSMAAAGTTKRSDASSISHYHNLRQTRYNVKDYGAVGDGSTDDTAAINTAAALVLASGGILYFPRGQYRITSTINLSKSGSASAVAIIVEGTGPRTSLISAVISGAPAFDCTGSSFISFRNFSISGNAVSIPTCGFLLARNTTQNSAGSHSFHNVQTLGYYSQAAVYNYASEIVQFTSCQFTNSTVGKPVVCLTKTNIFSLTSPFQTIATGQISTSVFTFTGCDINNYAGSGNSDALYIEGASSVTFDAGFMIAQGGRALVYIDASVSNAWNIAIKDTMWDGSNATYGLTVAGTNAVTRISLLNIADSGVKSAGSGGMTVYGQDGSTISGLRIENIYSQIALYYRFYQVSNSHIDLFTADTLYLKYACEFNHIAVDATKLTIDRRDLCIGNTIVALNAGAVINPRESLVVGDANKTLVTTDAPLQRWTSALTAGRTCTLPNTSLYQGARFHIVRAASATGAFNLTVQTSTPTTIKTLTAAGQWCIVEYTGSAWELIAAGSL